MVLIKMDRLEGFFVKFVLSLWIVIFSAGAIYYPLQDYTSLEQQDLYPVSLGLGMIVSGFMMYYLVRLHHLIFRNEQKQIQTTS